MRYHYMRLVGLLVGALAVCSLGFVFAVYDYTRDGKATTARSVASGIDAPSPAAEPSPTVYPSPPTFEPPGPLAAAQPAGSDVGTGPVALAPQQAPAAAPPQEAAVPAPAPADRRAKHQGGGHGGHGRGG